MKYEMCLSHSQWRCNGLRNSCVAIHNSYSKDIKRMVLWSLMPTIYSDLYARRRNSSRRKAVGPKDNGNETRIAFVCFSSNRPQQQRRTFVFIIHFIRFSPLCLYLSIAPSAYRIYTIQYVEIIHLCIVQYNACILYYMVAKSRGHRIIIISSPH